MQFREVKSDLNSIPGWLHECLPDVFPESAEWNEIIDYMNTEAVKEKSD